MKILSKKLKTAVLVLGVALGMMFGTTQRSKAAFYPNYITLSSIYFSYYQSTGIAQYYFDARAFEIYYLAGFDLDYYGYHYDRFAYKSTNYAGSIHALNSYNILASDGDYWASVDVNPHEYSSSYFGYLGMLVYGAHRELSKRGILP